MNKIIKNLIILIFIIIFIIAFSSSYFSLSLDNLAYVIAIGIDKSDENKLQVSFQFSTTPSSSESGSTEKAKTIINTVEASSISTAINTLDGYIGTEINLSHCKAIIFSEELAMEGISNEIYTLINDTQIRPSANIIISKCSAKYYLEQTSHEFESLISKYYEKLANASKYTGFLPDATIGDFFNCLLNKIYEPTAILGGLSTESNKGNTSIDDNSLKNYDIKANNTTIEGQNSTENVGMAVFSNGKLVGELTALETISFLSIGNKINRFLISIKDPYNDGNYLDIYLSPKNVTKIKVNTSTSSPYIQIQADYTGRIYSMSDNSKFLEPDVLDSISKTCNSYLESILTNYLYKTSRVFKSDINGLGKYALSNFFTTQELDNYNWHSNYQNAFFKVTVNTSIKSGMLITET